MWFILGLKKFKILGWSSLETSASGEKSGSHFGVVLFAAVLLGALMTIEPAGYGVLISAFDCGLGLCWVLCEKET